MALQKQIVNIPFAAGLDMKSDPRAMQPPTLAVCKNAQFDELGGIQTRKPYAEILDHANNTIADIRKIVEYDDELVAFSKDKLWSYAKGDGLWTERAEYLAVKVDEQSRFVSTGEQYDCDRAELGGVTMYCWTEDTPSGTVSYIAAIDTATGSVKLSPTSIKSGAVVPRLAVTTNKIILVFMVTTAVWARSYDVTDFSSAETSVAPGAAVAFDVEVDAATPTTAVITISRSAAYNVYSITETPVFSGGVIKSRIADGAISVAFDAADGDRICITRSNGTAIESDILDASFVDVNVGVSTGTASNATVNQIASAYDGLSTCRLFWSSGETVDQTTFESETNTVDNAGAAGTEETLITRAGLASRAFLRDGSVFVWTAFSSASVGELVGQLQNTYFLYRADGFLVAKAVSTQAGGFSATEGHLPGVQALISGQWAWSGTIRRIIPLGRSQKGYAAMSPHDVIFEFDSGEARRVAVLGETLYVAGGQVMQFDGRGLAEVGFATFPWHLPVSNDPSGSNLNGDYNWKQSYSWYNAKGEFERSTTANISSLTVVTDAAIMLGVPLNITAKTGGAGDVAVEFWRQVEAAPVSAPFYLISSKDPASTGDNSYKENTQGSGVGIELIDNILDANLISLETFPENGGLTLESLSPPSSSIIIATQDRIFLAGIPGNPHRLQYSKVRGDGEIAAFHDALYIDLPPDGGNITAIAFLNETLIVFKESAIYALPGDGIGNDQSGQNYGPARLLHSDVGAVSAEAVGLTSKGLLFKSHKGWFLLNHGWTANYIGGAVAGFDADTILSVHTMDAQHQVRCLTNNRLLVWDYLVNPELDGAWSEHDIQGGLSAALFDGVYHYTNGVEVLAERPDWSDSNGPQATLDGSHGVASTIITVNEDISAWPAPSALLFSPGLAAEEIKRIATRDSSTQFTLGPNSTDYTQADGAVVELARWAALNQGHSAGATIVNTSAYGGEFPTDGWMIVGYGTANEETVSFSRVGTVFTTSALKNSHSHGVDIVLVQAESMGLDIETGWIKFAGLQGYKRVKRFFLLGEYRGACDVRIRVAYDYEETESGPAWIDDKTWTATPAVVGGPMQLRHGPSKQKCQAIKVRITAQAVGSTLAPSNEALKLTGLALWLGVKGSPYKGLSAAQSQ